MRIKDGIETVTREVAQEYQQADVLVFPASVREVEGFAFQNNPNVAVVEFEEGVRAIGTCAFAGCTALRSVHLPQSLRAINGGAFRDCPSLQAVTFNEVTGEGDCIPLCAHVFDNCQVNADVIPQENKRRRVFHIRRIFDTVAREALFREWVDGYRNACGRLAAVENWCSADEYTLRFLIAARDNGIADIGQGATAMAGGAMQPENYGAYRNVAAAIAEAGRTGDWNNILRVLRETREEFFGLFHHPNNNHPWLVFNRIVAGLLPTYVVNVPDFNDLSHYGYGCLQGWGGIDHRNYQRESWFELSHEIRDTLSELLHPNDIFECGVFAWCLAERSNEGVRDNEERLPAFREAINSAMAVETRWFLDNVGR